MKDLLANDFNFITFHMSVTCPSVKKLTKFLVKYKAKCTNGTVLEAKKRVRFFEEVKHEDPINDK